ncbi:MAG: transposase [Euzebyaceae bacterium]|nr:transposase [Euzebyaceae bacterium]
MAPPRGGPRQLPKPHWRRIWSINPLERINKELKRRAYIVGILPDDAAVIRLIGAAPMEQHDEWQGAERRCFSEESMKPISMAEDPGDTRAARGVACRHNTARHPLTSTLGALARADDVPWPVGDPVVGLSNAVSHFEGGMETAVLDYDLVVVRTTVVDPCCDLRCPLSAPRRPAGVLSLAAPTCSAGTVYPSR